MLIKCPECELQVSDKALSCPHCGYPLQKQTKSTTSRKNKRMRLPNGFGQISEIKGRNLRNPFRAMVSIGKTPEGKPISVMLRPQAYFRTYNDAYEALVEYHKNPYELDKSITMLELYEKWSTEYFKTLKSESSMRTVTAAWAYCGSIKKMMVADIRARHIKGVMENGTANINGKERSPSPGTKARIKSLFNLMLDYAVEYEIVDRNYARTFNVSDDIIKEKERAKRAHIPFTEEEISILWNSIETCKYVDIILIQIYTGFRPQELCLLEIENIKEGFIKGGMKTEAGIDRLVPIHPRIEHLIIKKIKEAEKIDSKYLINCVDEKNTRMTYDKYQRRFLNVMQTLGLNADHRAHDPRVHFITMAKKYKMDEYAIKYMVGHAINDVTEKIYTKREKDWLTEEIKKIV